MISLELVSGLLFCFMQTEKWMSNSSQSSHTSWHEPTFAVFLLLRPGFCLYFTALSPVYTVSSSCALKLVLPLSQMLFSVTESSHPFIILRLNQISHNSSSKKQSPFPSLLNSHFTPYNLLRILIAFIFFSFLIIITSFSDHRIVKIIEWKLSSLF